MVLGLFVGKVVFIGKVAGGIPGWVLWSFLPMELGRSYWALGDY